MANLPSQATCPVCHETVDLTDVPAATAHMYKDDAHKKAAGRAKSAAALEEFLDRVSPILRRVGD